MSSSYTCRDLEDALKVADKIREAVEEGFDEIKKEVHSKAKSKLKDKHKITVSIGVAEYKVDLEQEDELVEFFDAKNRADRYMQVAKKEMKNFVYSGDDDFLFPNKPGLYNAVEDLTKMIEMYTTRVPQRIIGRFGRKLSKVVSRYRRFKKTSRD
jgi:CRISPR/Cas system-associated exonuclease Cas4 (RecB family)